LKENKDVMCKPKSNTSVIAGDDDVAVVGGKRRGAELDANKYDFVANNESEEAVAANERSADQSNQKEAVGRKKKRRETDESAALSDGAMADELM
jgi:hypothetical protein